MAYQHRTRRLVSTFGVGLLCALGAWTCSSTDGGGSPADGASGQGGGGGGGGGGSGDTGGSGARSGATGSSSGSAVSGRSGGTSGGSASGKDAGSDTKTARSGSSGGSGAPSTTPSDWQNVRIGGGGYVTGIIHHPKTGGPLYVRTDMGGAYRYDDVGARWVPILDWIGRDYGHFYGVLSLAVDPNDDAKVYAMVGTYTDPSWAGKGGLLRSSDRGQTWDEIHLEGKAVGGATGVWVGGNEVGRGVGERLQVDPHLGTVLFMGTTKAGLWKSIDAGSTWTPVTGTGLTATTNVNFVLFDPNSGADGEATPRIVVSTTDTTGSGLLVSQDGGATWAAVEDQPAGLMALRPALGGDTLYLTYAENPGPNNSASEGGGVFKLKVGEGTKWPFTKVTPAAWSHAYGGVSVDPADARHVIVSSLFNWDNEDVYESKDGGSTWTALKVEAAIDAKAFPHVDGAHIHWVTDVQFDPHDTSAFSFITGQGFYRCKGLASKLGCSFDDVGLEELVPLQLVSPPKGPPLLSVVGDRDGFRHDDLAVSPAKFSPSKGTTRSLAFAEAVPETLVKSFDKEPFGAISKDNGTSWKDFAAAPKGSVACVDYFCGTRNIAISADAKRIVWSPVTAQPSWSADDGGTWTACQGIAVDTAKLPPRPVADRVNADKFYAFDVMSGLVYRSSDGGETFTASAKPLPHASADWAAGNFELATVFGKEGHLWLAASNGATGTTGGAGLWRSTDSGATFTQVGAGTLTAAYKVGFGAAAAGADYPAIFIWGTVGGVTGIFRSTDEGASWVRQNDDQHQFGTLHAVIGDPKTFGRVYVAAEGRGILFATKE